MANEPNAILTQKIEVSPGLAILRVVPEGWDLFDFTPGQFAVLGLDAPLSGKPTIRPIGQLPRSRLRGHWRHTLNMESGTRLGQLVHAFGKKGFLLA